ncbi:MAG: GNAT family N-acetyltransferase [Burkholderiales bacterium]
MDSAPNAATSVPAVKVRWQWSRFPELAAAELYAALAARQQVFTVEQHCAFQDADGYDLDAWHLFAWAADPPPVVWTPTPPEGAQLASWDDPAALVLAGYLRVLDPGRKFAEPSIGRVLTVAAYRGIGFGRTLMAEGIARTRRIWPGRPVRIAAQQRLERFYASLGFRTAGAPYEEDDIAHVDMLLPA